MSSLRYITLVSVYGSCSGNAKPAVYVAPFLNLAAPYCKLKMLHQVAQVAAVLIMSCTVIAESSLVPLLAVIASLQPKSVPGVCIPPTKLLSRGF